MRIRIGTRGSQLALWQANTVAARLQTAWPDLVCELVTIKTTGDRLSEASLSQAGGKRLFVKEIEEALLDGSVDVAVHSAKDMPADSPDRLTIGGVLPREEPWDAVVLPKGKSSPPTPPQPLGEGSRREGARVPGRSTLAPSDPLQGAKREHDDISLAEIVARVGAAGTVGTSSVRRVAQLRRLFPTATFKPIRGNLDTRLRKLDEGQYDLLVLATAGLKRLGAADRISARLPLDACLPAPGQGIVAIQVRADDAATRERVDGISNREAAAALAAERTVVEALGGNCSIPIGAIAMPAAGDRLDVQAIVSSFDGTRVLRAQTSGAAADAAALGQRVADDLLAQGAGPLLEELMRSR